MEEIKKLQNTLESIRPDIDFKQNSSLIDDGILDSFDIITIIGELNDTFGINISVEHIIPENFNSLNAMMKLVSKLMEE